MRATTAISTKKETVNKTNTAIVLSNLEKKASPLFKKLSQIGNINSQDSFDNAAALVKQLKELGKLAEVQKRTMLEPVKETEKRIREHFKPFETKLLEIETAIKLQMSIFLEDNKKKLAKIDEEFGNGKIKKIGTYTNKVNDLQVQSTSAQIRKVKKLEIYSAKDIPAEYLVPDEDKIMAALKQGKEVPGCRIVIVENIAI